MDKLPVGVPIGIGNSRDGYVETYWEGFFVRYDDQSFTAVVQHQISPRYWPEAIGARSWLDLLYRSVQSRLGTVPDLQIGEYDDSEEVEIRFEYSFSIGARDLKAAFDEGVRIQEDVEAPAESVLSDVTKTLAASANKVLRGQYAQVASLVAKVEAAESADEKGSSLESLMMTLFEQVPGFSVWQTNVHSRTEEMDLIVLNGSQDAVFSKDGPIILIECKNWTAKTGRPEFSILEGKIRNRHGRCTIAFLVSWAGFTETTWLETLRLSREQYAVICLDGTDIRSAALTGNFPEFLRQKTIAILTS